MQFERLIVRKTIDHLIDFNPDIEAFQPIKLIEINFTDHTRTGRFLVGYVAKLDVLSGFGSASDTIRLTLTI